MQLYEHTHNTRFSMPNSGVSQARGAPRGGGRCPRCLHLGQRQVDPRGHLGQRNPTTGPEVGTHPGHRHPRLGPRGRSPRAAPPCEPPAPRDNAALPEGRPSPPLPGVVGRHTPVSEVEHGEKSRRICAICAPEVRRVRAG